MLVFKFGITLISLTAARLAVAGMTIIIVAVGRA
jgi:hypothetical protein